MTLPPFYRLAEVTLYALLNFLPFLVLALYPFRHNLRFSLKVTILLVVLLSIIQIGIGIWVAFFAGNTAGFFSLLSTILYAAFYFLAVRKSPGKALFTLLMISNLANFTVIASKCLEGQFFPDLAIQKYRWSSSLFLFLVEAALAAPFFIYVRNIFTPEMEQESSSVTWRYLWCVPATFYLTWYYALYGNSTLTSLEIALLPRNTLFMSFLNLGAVLIYYLVSRLILEQNRAITLQEKNHLLTMQAMQYDTLQEKITDARRVKHDVRHHITTMQEYVRQKDYDALDHYLSQYQESLPDDSLLHFCENTAVNAVLLYFSSQAKKYDISYQTQVKIPEHLPIEETDLSVLFGNLLENALDACRVDAAPDKKIVVRGTADNYSLCITIDNTFTGTLRKTSSGNFLSSKHRGVGIGTQSVRNISEKYGGVTHLEAHDGMFFASVMCFFASEPSVPTK